MIFSRVLLLTFVIFGFLTLSAQAFSSRVWPQPIPIKPTSKQFYPYFTTPTTTTKQQPVQTYNNYKVVAPSSAILQPAVQQVAPVAQFNSVPQVAQGTQTTPVTQVTQVSQQSPVQNNLTAPTQFGENYYLPQNGLQSFAKLKIPKAQLEKKQQLAPAKFFFDKSYKNLANSLKITAPTIKQVSS